MGLATRQHGQTLDLARRLLLNWGGRGDLPVECAGEDQDIVVRKRNRTAGTLLFVGLLAGALAARAEAQAPTNFELVREAARQASQQLIESMGDAAFMSALAIRGVGEHEGNFLVESTLSSVLAEGGYSVRTKPDSVGPVLEFEIVDLGLTYTRVWRHAWLGSRQVEREARARLFARLIDDKQTSILWAQQADAKVFDEVPVKELERLQEKSTQEYLKAELPPRTWNKIVEPVVVTGIVVGLIILFFSNQSSN